MSKSKNIYITDKSIGLASDEEILRVKKILLNDEYVDFDGVLVAKAKIGKPRQDVFEKELELCKFFKSKNHEIHLLRENYTKGKGADTICDGVFTDIKHVEKPKEIGNRYSEGRNQGTNIFMFVEKSDSVKNAVNQIFGRIKLKLKSNLPAFGKVFIYFADKRLFLEMTIKKDGHATYKVGPS